MSEKMKPCPFCGGEAEIQHVTLERICYAVGCKDCSCGLEWFDTKEEAIEAWNNRPLEKEKYFNGYKQGLQDCMEFVQKHVFFNSVV